MQSINHGVNCRKEVCQCLGLQGLEDWARLYVRYVQAFRRLCDAHEGLANPQKRAALCATLEACLGRLLELRSWLAELAGGCNVLDLGQQLADLQLTPDALELPVPGFFREARAEALAARAAAAAAAIDAAVGPVSWAGVPDGQAGAEKAPDDASVATSAAAEQEGTRAQHATCTSPAVNPLTNDAPSFQPGSSAGQPQALQPIAEVAAGAPAAEPEHAQQAARRAAAATAVQAGVRSWLARRRLAAERQEELEFLGMAPPAGGGRSAALAGSLAAVTARRKQLQAVRLAEMAEAMVDIKAGLRQREGWAMKERIRDKVRPCRGRLAG